MTQRTCKINYLNNLFRWMFNDFRVSINSKRYKSEYFTEVGKNSFKTTIILLYLISIVIEFNYLDNTDF